jgi:hypothetical protein
MDEHEEEKEVSVWIVTHTYLNNKRVPGFPSRLDHIMVVMVTIWSVDGALKEADTRMQDGDQCRGGY